MEKLYRIDFDKVKSLDDVILILKSLEIRYSTECKDFEDIHHLLTEIEPNRITTTS